MLKQLSAAGAVVATSSVVTSAPAFAAAGSCCRAAASYTLIGACVPNTPISTTCQRVFINQITVCRRLTTTTMTMSRNANGTFRPYFDEVGTLYVTSPLGVTRVQNFVGYQNTCRRTPTEPDLSGFGSGNGDPCTNPSNSPTNVTPLFGNECGQFVVRIEVWNGFTPYGFSTCYLRGS